MKIHLLLLVMVLCACAHTNRTNDLWPVKAVRLICGGQEYSLVYTDSWASWSGGAGFTCGGDKVPSEYGARYEEQHCGAFLKNGKEWLFYEYKHLGNGEWGASDTPTPCKLIHVYSKDEIMKLGGPYFTITESGEIIHGEFE